MDQKQFPPGAVTGLLRGGVERCQVDGQQPADPVVADDGLISQAFHERARHFGAHRSDEMQPQPCLPAVHLRHASLGQPLPAHAMAG